MNRYASILAAAILIVFSSYAMSASTEGNTGLLFGANHAFAFTATRGWILDNKSGVQQGLHMVFYPIGFTWANSPVIAYGRSVTKTKTRRTIADQVRDTVNEFHQEDNPTYKSKMGEQFKLRNGRVVHLYYFSGDKWGNYEAVGYIEEENTINFLVFNARKKEDYDKYISDFKSIVSTYDNRYSKDIDDVAFTRLVDEAKKLSATEEGKYYEHKLMQNLGPSLANIMRDCTSYTSKKDNAGFELVFRVKPSGQAMELYARPSNSLTSCVKGMVSPIVHPPHKFKTFVEYIEMKIED